MAARATRRTGLADGGGAWRRGADRDTEVRGDPNTWGPPARERGGERESWAGPGRGGRGDFLFFFTLVIYLFSEIE